MNDIELDTGMRYTYSTGLYSEVYASGYKVIVWHSEANYRSVRYGVK
jgi:hypothetical protein